jgi:hypothetical protein
MEDDVREYCSPASVQQQQADFCEAHKLMYPGHVARAGDVGSQCVVDLALPFLPGGGSRLADLDVLDSLDAHTALAGLRGEPDRVCVLGPGTTYKLLEIVQAPDARFTHHRVRFVQSTTSHRAYLTVTGLHENVFGRVEVLSVPNLDTTSPFVVFDDILMPIELDPLQLRAAGPPSCTNGVLSVAGVRGYIFLQHLCRDLELSPGPPC